MESVTVTTVEVAKDNPKMLKIQLDFNQQEILMEKGTFKIELQNNQDQYGNTVDYALESQDGTKAYLEGSIKVDGLQFLY